MAPFILNMNIYTHLPWHVPRPGCMREGAACILAYAICMETAYVVMLLPSICTCIRFKMHGEYCWYSHRRKPHRFPCDWSLSCESALLLDWMHMFEHSPSPNCIGINGNVVSCIDVYRQGAHLHAVRFQQCTNLIIAGRILVWERWFTFEKSKLLEISFKGNLDVPLVISPLVGEIRLWWWWWWWWKRQSIVQYAIVVSFYDQNSN